MIVQPVPHLIFRTDHGERYLPLVTGNCWTIGRSDDSHVVLDDRWISRNHAMLQSMDSGEYYLIDLGSRNGTFVNGRRVTIPVVLRHGDRLTFGDTHLEFYCPTRVSSGNELETPSEGGDYTATQALHVRRLISVLVMDIRNYTVLTRQMDEQQLSEMIGSWFREAGRIIQKYGSNVDKYIGDAIMAVWIHGSQDEIAREEVLSIFQALSDLHYMTEQLQKRFPLPLPLRVGAGVNTGHAMVGNTGSRDRPDYTALGDTVNAAFRLEASTKEIRQDVAIGEMTYQCLDKALEGQSSPFGQYQVNLKGYDKPTVTYACSFVALDEFLERR